MPTTPDRDAPPELTLAQKLLYVAIDMRTNGGFKLLHAYVRPDRLDEIRFAPELREIPTIVIFVPENVEFDENTRFVDVPILIVRGTDFLQPHEDHRVSPTKIDWRAPE